MLKPMYVLVTFLLSAFSLQQSPVPPVATAIPPEAVAMVNPVKPTAASQAHAKKVYGYDCAVCHGVTGDGKGELSANFKTPLKDFTDPASLQNRTDGELFYILKNGSGEMTGEGDRTKPEDIWNLVILVRWFAKK